MEDLLELEKSILETLLGTKTYLSFVKFNLPFCLATSFSEAYFRGIHHKDEKFEQQFHVGLEFWDTFVLVKEVFQHRLNSPDADLGEKFGEVVGMAYNHFLKFIEGHRAVLHEMEANKKLWKDEFQFNVFVAREILNPLSGGLCLLNSDHQSALKASKMQHKKKTEKIFLPEEHGWNGLGMGYEDGYYGEPDIILIPEEKETEHTVIQAAFTEIDDDDDDDGEEEEEQDRKKRKKEGNSSEPDDGSPDGKTAIEGKKSYKQKPDVHELSQCFATAIAFANIQRKRHSELDNFPVIRIHPGGFDIIIYNCEFDLLLTKCFGWTTRSFPFLWVVLHYKIFRMRRLSEYKKYTCGYRELAEMHNSLPKTDYKYGVNKAHFNIADVSFERDNVEMVLTK